MEETREQPIITPAEALNGANENGVVGEVGSQTGDLLGKFKSVEALMEAYTSLQGEFTKKCQKLSEMEKEKIEEGEKPSENDNTLSKESTDFAESETLEQFLETNREAGLYLEEIKAKLNQNDQPAKNSPYAVAWAEVILSHLKEEGKHSDPLINQYVLSDEGVRNKIVEAYLQDLSNLQPPITISSQGGTRVSGVVPDAPKSLKEAKAMVDKMFS